MVQNRRNPAGPLEVRRWGPRQGRPVVLVHGGPGAAGYLEPVARELSRRFCVLEPWQRGSGPEPLSVATHVRDLRTVLEECAEPPAVVGHSWGAMLALACAARHPQAQSGVVLVGCGTFDPVARSACEQTLRERMGQGLRTELRSLPGSIPDPDQRLAAMGRLLMPVYSHELVEDHDVCEPVCDARAHHETWADMLRLQDSGIYPAAFRRIRVPVLMLHGKDDPHPGAMTAATLRRYVPQLDYVELSCCGHYPWLERRARERFLHLLAQWLVRGSPGMDALADPHIKDA